MFRSLFEPRQSTLRYFGFALAVDLAPSLLLGIALLVLVGESLAEATLPSWTKVLVAIVGAPLVETVIMAGLLTLLRRLIRTKMPVVIISAVMWSALHAIGNPLAGAFVFWPFFVFSASYVALEERSKHAAFWTSAALHAAHNSFLLLSFIAWKLF